LFEGFFKKLYSHNPEIRLVGIWGKDGLGLEETRFGEVGVDLELIGAEMADIVSKISHARFTPKSYSMKLKVNESLLNVYELTPEFFLIVVSTEDIITGKLNFYVGRYKAELISKL
jgi:predicted regulator of Ras-like GTPase activity (Roadblock/LC7/MglB family)